MASQGAANDRLRLRIPRVQPGRPPGVGIAAVLTPQSKNPRVGRGARRPGASRRRKRSNSPVTGRVVSPPFPGKSAENKGWSGRRSVDGDVVGGIGSQRNHGLVVLGAASPGSRSRGNMCRTQGRVSFTRRREWAGISAHPSEHTIMSVITWVWPRNWTPSHPSPAPSPVPPPSRPRGSRPWDRRTPAGPTGATSRPTSRGWICTDWTGSPPSGQSGLGGRRTRSRGRAPGGSRRSGRRAPA